MNYFRRSKGSEANEFISFTIDLSPLRERATEKKNENPDEVYVDKKITNYCQAGE
jgi:hypothetical protein